jgi:hypothetical protein
MINKKSFGITRPYQDDGQYDPEDSSILKKKRERLEKGIAALYSNGQSLRIVAEFFKVSHEYVRQVLKENGVTIRSYKKETPVKIGDKRTTGGYVDIFLGKSNPSANKDGWAKEHRVIMERHLNRKLEIWEVVHHKNRNKKDNRIENLEVMASHDHPTCLDCPYYKFYLEQGGKDLTQS